MCVCMCVRAIRRPRAHHNSMRALRHAIIQAVMVVNVLHVHVNSKYDLLHGPRMYSKLISETEQLRRDLVNTDKRLEKQ